MDFLGLRKRLSPVAAAIACAAGMVLLLSPGAAAQISPGELTTAHANLEGLDNCTKCHVLGKAIANEKCLSCHGEIRARMDARTGYHAQLQQKQCAECHSEHHGRNFELIRFATRTFDHASVGYRLEGKHATLECKTCHAAEHIKAADVLRNRTLTGSRTYLGLGRACLDCHVDTHRGQLAPQCLTCHGMDGWKPAVKFTHDQAKYRLTGKHQQAACASCHTTMPDAKRTVKYAGLRFDRCSSCHSDPHEGRFLKPCESCHTTQGWNTGEARRFDHATTRFPLKGRHAAVPCESCHLPVREAGGKVVQVFAIKRFQRCADCHADPHRGEFAKRSDGGACESCHNEQGFRPSLFVHSTARYRLEGKHTNVQCSKCHGVTIADAAGRRIPPSFVVRRYQRCMDCHNDEHGGQLLHRRDGGACESCHTVDGYIPARYSSDDHGKNGFQLTGAHAAVGCERCHPANKIRAASTREFRWPQRPSCETCHKDVHRGQFAELMRDGCATCHTVDRWTLVKFSHDRTRFPLRGKHVDVSCGGCHRLIDRGAPEQRVQYAGTPIRCVDCHSDAGVANAVTERAN